MMFTPYQLYPKGYFHKKHYTDVIQTDGQKKTTTRLHRILKNTSANTLHTDRQKKRRTMTDSVLTDKKT